MNEPALDIRSETAPVVLLADDDESICIVIRQALRRRGFTVRVTHNGAELLRWVGKGLGDAVITDVMMPEMSGLDALSEIRLLRPELPVVVISAQSTLMTAVEATERGANEYFPKPFDLHQLVECVARLLPEERPAEKEPAPSPSMSGDLIGSSPAMQNVYRSLAKLTKVDLTVLLEGESGTGKEVIARKLHALSLRKDKSFVALNMAAIPRDLVESELFGHEKGAFTGALARRKGKFAQAEGGTLFLDEIGDMPLDAQAKLLRVLQEGEYTPVGGTIPYKTDVRILCATHQNLEALCRSGEFREDLYYRLHVVPIHIPPLRERTEDIPLLAEFFLRQARKKGVPQKRLSQEAMRMLVAYRWPGNVRELENSIYRIAALSGDDVISGEQVEAQLKRNDVPKETGNIAFSDSFQDTVTRLLSQYFEAHSPSLPPPGVHGRIVRLTEKPLIMLALDAVGGNQIQAAELLGINRNTLRKKIRELGITVERNVRGDT